MKKLTALFALFSCTMTLIPAKKHEDPLTSLNNACSQLYAQITQSQIRASEKLAALQTSMHELGADIRKVKDELADIKERFAAPQPSPTDSYSESLKLLIAQHKQPSFHNFKKE